MTITMNTMLASPLGPNHPRKSFESLRIGAPIKQKNTGTIRTSVRLRIA